MQNAIFNKRNDNEPLAKYNKSFFQLYQVLDHVHNSKISDINLNSNFNFIIKFFI